MSYYDPENEDELRTAEFRLAGFLPLEGVAADPFLTPEFPGITDRTTIDQWNPPPQLHFDNRRVKRPDDEWFWDEFRTTPKAYVTLHRGEQLWGQSRFGKYTSIRLAPDPTLVPKLQFGNESGLGNEIRVYPRGPRNSFSNLHKRGSRPWLSRARSMLSPPLSQRF